MELMVLYLFLLSGFFFLLLAVIRRSVVNGFLSGSVFLLSGLSILADGISLVSGQTIVNDSANLTYTFTYSAVKDYAVSGVGLVLVLFSLLLFFIFWTMRDDDVVE